MLILKKNRKNYINQFRKLKHHANTAICYSRLEVVDGCFLAVHRKKHCCKHFWNLRGLFAQLYFLSCMSIYQFLRNFQLAARYPCQSSKKNLSEVFEKCRSTLKLNLKASSQSTFLIDLITHYLCLFSGTTTQTIVCVTLLELHSNDNRRFFKSSRILPLTQKTFQRALTCYKSCPI